MQLSRTQRFDWWKLIPPNLAVYGGIKPVLDTKVSMVYLLPEEKGTRMSMIETHGLTKQYGKFPELLYFKKI